MFVLIGTEGVTSLEMSVCQLLVPYRRKNYYRVRVMVFNATFNNFSVISWRKSEYPEKTTDLPQVTDKQRKYYNI